MVQAIKSPALTDDTNDDNVDQFAESVAVAQRLLKRMPNMQARDLFEKIILPLLGHIREDQANLEEVVFSDTDTEGASFVDRASELVLKLSALIDTVILHSGFRGEDGNFTEKAPADVVALFNDVLSDIQVFNTEVADIKAALSASEDDEEDEEDEEDEAEDEEDGAEEAKNTKGA